MNNQLPNYNMSNPNLSNQMLPFPQNYGSGNDMKNLEMRVNRLERDLRRLEGKVNRLEQGNQPYSQNPNNSSYQPNSYNMF